MTGVVTLRNIYRMSEIAAEGRLRDIRWPAGVQCPRCAAPEPYSLAKRRRFKCVACYHQFSVTSGTIFASRKLKHGDILAAAFVFARAAKGISSIQLSTTLGLNQRSTWRLAHNFREALKAENDNLKLQGVVEIDGATFGGHRRIVVGGLTSRNFVRRYGNRRVIVIAKERLGRTIPIICTKEADAKEELCRRLLPGCTIMADGARAWDSLSALYESLRVNHVWTFKANGCCTNNAESFFSAMRKMYDGTHHHLSAQQLPLYAAELAWRRDCTELGLSPAERTAELLRLCLSDRKRRAA